MTPAAALDAQRVAVKLLCRTPHDLSPREFVPVFHRFIQRQQIDGLLIDVVDYRHVYHGPGVVLIGHEADLCTDQEGGALGLLYRRKQPAAGDFVARLAEATGALLTAARLLEAEPAFSGRLQYLENELQVRWHDRLHAPNEAGTWSLLAPEIERFARRLWPDGATIEPFGEPRQPFGARLLGVGERRRDFSIS